MTAPLEKPARKSGLAHFLAASGYSMAGARRLVRESAVRQELVGLGVLFVAVATFGATWPELAGLVALGLVLIAIEALNTAVEVLVDHLSPGWSEFARDAKDLGSLAVASMIAAIAVYSGIVLIW